MQIEKWQLDFEFTCVQCGELKKEKNNLKLNFQQFFIFLLVRIKIILKMPIRKNILYPVIPF